MVNYLQAHEIKVGIGPSTPTFIALHATYSLNVRYYCMYNKNVFTIKIKGYYFGLNLTHLIDNLYFSKFPIGHNFLNISIMITYVDFQLDGSSI
jgi:hypothetical protein